MEGVLCDLSVIKKLPVVVREGGWKVTATLVRGWRGN